MRINRIVFTCSIDGQSHEWMDGQVKRRTNGKRMNGAFYKESDLRRMLKEKKITLIHRAKKRRWKGVEPPSVTLSFAPFLSLFSPTFILSLHSPFFSFLFFSSPYFCALSFYHWLYADEKPRKGGSIIISLSVYAFFSSSSSSSSSSSHFSLHPGRFLRLYPTSSEISLTFPPISPTTPNLS